MSIATSPAAGQVPRSELPYRVNPLRRTDNVTNWYYLAREYLLLGTMVGLAIAFWELHAGWGLSWAWAVPVYFLAVLLIGAGQHRLTTLGHEASHYLLFRNRLLNELASDLLCMYPMWSTTHFYRLQHLAHHQFPNDPVRDPDVTQMEASGHRYQFPMSPGRFVWECVIKQFFSLPGLIRYVRYRARFASTGGGGYGPYRAEEGTSSRLLIRAGVFYLLGLLAALTGLVFWGNAVALAVVPPVFLVCITAFYALVPGHYYRSFTFKPTVPPRWTAVLRMTYVSVLWTTLAWLTYLTGWLWAAYYIALWLVPLMTTFSFFMILRQIVQHGNADQGRFTNTRVFLVGRLIRWSVFPLGMDYHVPHHLFPLVPHYRLPQLHDLLMCSELRDEVTIAEGYFFHRRPPEHATVLELMAAPPSEIFG
jgi:fatty acid desaturase